jgi:hypothetical protein
MTRQIEEDSAAIFVLNERQQQREREFSKPVVISAVARRGTGTTEPG